MKKLLTILALLPLFIAAQNISVKSFKSVPDDMTARVTNAVTDQNGDKCALIKVRTTQTGFVFEGDMLGITKTIQEVGEIWIYLPAKAKRITIKHAKLGVLDNYLYPVSIKEATVYILELTTAKVTTVVEEYVIPTNWLIVSSEPEGADVYINDVNKGITPFQQEMEEGEYSYLISTNLYHAEAGKFTISATGERTQLKATLKPNFGYAKITTTPESATVYLNGAQLANTTPCTTNRLKPGKYTLVVKKPMYFDETKEITIIDGQTIDVAITLRPTFGGFTINSQPESGATVFLDGQSTSKVTPCTLSKLSNGEHTITLRKEWYQPKTEKINILAGQNQETTITLQPTFGTLNVTAEHNANIYIDNEFKANGNWEGRLIAGYHTIEAKLDKHTPDSKKVNIELGQTSNLSLHPAPQYGSLKIVTNPFDAIIKLNDKEQGLSPKNINNLLVGTYNLSLTKTGYGTISKSITITEGQTTTINETLPNGKQITINSQPQGATLFLAGQSKGVTPQTLTLGFADHALKLVNGEKTVEQIITISQTGKTSWSFDVSESEPLVDSRNNQTYKTVKIGKQTWMAENLNYKTTNSYCYDDNTSNCQKYGRLYTWQAAKNACPSGWHLPSDGEWKLLEKQLGMKLKKTDKIGYRGTNQGRELKATSGWNSNGNGTEFYG
ncbi:MAG: PEGA domain-containing protein [Salinivirgaceae bacterium]|jgi:hypothetical protein|nr:PEGA domain-containing protein [Salinivirgaceae bacterium]